MLTPKTTQPRPSPAFEEVSCQGFDLFCSLTRRQLPETVPVRKVYGLPRASFSRNLAVQVLPLAMCLAPPPALRDFHPVEFAHAERTKNGARRRRSHPNYRRGTPCGAPFSRQITGELTDLFAHNLLACNPTGGVSEAAGVTAAVEGSVNTGNGFTGCIEVVNRFHVPTQNLEVFVNTNPAAGEVVPRFHTDHVVRAFAERIHILVAAAELQVVMVLSCFCLLYTSPSPRDA